MEPVSPGRVLSAGKSDGAVPLSSFQAGLTNGNSNVPEPELGTKDSVLTSQNKGTGYVQTNPNNGVSPSPGVPRDLQSSPNPVPKTGLRTGIENGISLDPSPIVKKDSRAIISGNRSVHGRIVSTSPSASPTQPGQIKHNSPIQPFVNGGQTKQEPPQVLERRDSVLSLSKGSSYQARYHENCTPPPIDPSLIIGGSRRTPSPRYRRGRRPTSVKRPGSNVSLLSRRESITNLVFSGSSAIDQGEDAGGWDKLYKKRMSLGTFSYASSLFSRMSSPTREPNVTPGQFDVMEDEDYSCARLSKLSASSSSPHRLVQCPARPGFLYQVTTFDYLAKDVPPFVKSYAQKNGKMLPESFILRVNYLRRRRLLGEVSSTISLGNNNNNNNHSKRPGTGGERLSGSPR